MTTSSRTSGRKSNQKIRRMVLLAMFSAIIVLLGITPLGLIPITPLMKATTLHIPVIIGAILLGPADGAILGGVFGIMSFISILTNTIIPPETGPRANVPISAGISEKLSCSQNGKAKFIEKPNTYKTPATAANIAITAMRVALKNC